MELLEFIKEFLNAGNYGAILIISLIAAVGYLSRSLKQKDEFILKEYENLEESIAELKHAFENLQREVVELRIAMTRTQNKEVGG